MKSKNTSSDTPGPCKALSTAILALILLLSTAGDLHAQAGSSTPDYAAIYGERYEDALRFIHDNPWIADSLRSYGLDPEWVLSIVFPELIRYSTLRDQIETSALFTLYVQYGQDYADFSIGPFQIKPSCAERLEKEFTTLRNKPGYSREWLFITSEGVTQRKTRITRLTDTGWQLRYLLMMVIVLDERFKTIRWTNPVNKLEFYASAYNSGFHLSYQEISKARERENFHTALLIAERRYNYAGIARDFYLKQSGQSGQ